MDEEVEDGYFSTSNVTWMSMQPAMCEDEPFDHANNKITMPVYTTMGSDQDSSFSLLEADLDYSGVQFLNGKGILIERIHEAHKIIDGLNTRLHQYETEISNLKYHNKILLVKLNGLESERQVALTNHKIKDVLLDKVNNMSSEFASLLQNQQSLISKHNQQENAKLQLQTQFNDSLKECEDLKMKNEKLQLTQDVTKSKLDAITMNECVLLNKLSTMEVEKKNISIEYNHILQENGRQEKEILKLEDHMELLNNCVDQKNVMIKKREKVLEELRNHLNDLQNELNRSVEEKNETQTGLVCKLQNEVNICKTSNEQLITQLNEISEELKTKDENYNSIRIEKTKVEENLKNKELHTDQLKQENIDLTELQNGTMKSLSRYKKNRLYITEKYKALVTDYKKLNYEKDILQEKFDISVKNNKELSLNCDSIKKHSVMECNSLLVKHKEEIDILESKNESLQSTLQNIKNTSISLEEENEILLGEKVLEVQMQQLEMNDLLKRNRTAQMKFSDIESKYKDLLVQENSNDKQISKAKLQITNLNEKLKTQNILFCEYKVEAVNEIDGLKAQLSINNKDVENKVIENCQLESKKIAELNIKYENLQTVYNELMLKYKSKAEEVNVKTEQNHRLVDQLKESYLSEIDRLKQSNFEVETEHERLCEKWNSVHADNKKLKEELSRKLNEIEFIEEKLSLKSNENELTKEKLYIKINEVELLEEKLSVKANELHILKEELSMKINEIELSKEEIQTNEMKTKGKYSRLENGIHEKASQLEKLQKELTENINAKKILNTEVANLTEKLTSCKATLSEHSNSKHKTEEIYNKTIKDCDCKYEKLKGEYRKKVLQLQEAAKQHQEFRLKISNFTEEIEVLKELNSKLEDMNLTLQRNDKQLNEKLEQNEYDLKTIKASYEDLLSKELSKQKSEFLYKENQLLKKLAQST